MQEGALTSFFLLKSRRQNSLVKDALSVPRRKKCSYLHRQGEVPREISTNKPCSNSPYLPWVAPYTLVTSPQLPLSVQPSAVLSRSVVSDSLDHSPPGSSVHGDSPGKSTRVGCHALLQGIFTTQGSNPGLQHCRRILYHLSNQGN